MRVVTQTRNVRHVFELDAGGGEHVPAVFQLPAGGAPVPGVVLLHGFSARKEQMADSLGLALLKHNVASLAIDLPLHGARESGIEGLSLQNPVAVVQKWRLAVSEANSAISYLAAQPGIDARRLAIAGYSLGAYLAVIVGAGNPLVRAVALAAGGDLPEHTPFAALVRAIADPRRAVRALAGRPLLMVNGRADRTIRAEQARALFEAAGEPKELRWYDGGHWPPAAAVEWVAEWLAAIGEDLEPGRPRSATSGRGSKQPLD